jgi:hypothetical protein
VIASCDHELLHQATIRDRRESPTKFVAAACGDQHATSVRSPNMSATIIRNSHLIEVADVYSNRGQQTSVFSHKLLNLAYDSIEFVDEI